MSTNYSEQIFQSIDTIISQRLNEVSFDKTEICEVVSQDKNDKRKYLVSNGSLKYEAYSDDENRSYLNNQKVYVRITNGNYSLRKIITGSYAADETNENLYVNPFNHLVISEQHHCIMESNKLSATAYLDNTKDEDSYIINDLTFYQSGFDNFTYIGLDFSMSTGFGGTTGEFLIIIDLLDNNGVSLLTDKELGLVTLSSKQLYGNPYYLNDKLRFQHLFNFPIGNFSDLTQVKKIKITLVTKGNFNYRDNNSEITEDDLSKVILNDLILYFGFKSSIEKMSKNDVKLVLDNTELLEYTTIDDKKQMSIDWRDLETNAIYNETSNMQYPKFGKYNIYWLQYSESIGYTKHLETTPEDEREEGIEYIDIVESGTYWKTIKCIDATLAEAYTYILSPSPDWKKEQIKVIIKNTETNDYIESNGLTFINTKFRMETGSNAGKQDTLKLTLAEGDDGIYNNYGIDNKLLHKEISSHTVTVDYIDNTEWNKYLQKVIWRIPAKASMIKMTELQYDETTEQYIEQIKDGWVLSEDEKYYEYKNDSDAKTISFDLSDQYGYGKTNNTISCHIIRYKSKDSNVITDEYQGSINLWFGTQGTAGSGYAFNIYPNHPYGLTNSTPIVFTAKLENNSGEPMPLESTNIKWYYMYGDQIIQEYDEDEKRYIPMGQGQSFIVNLEDDRVDSSKYDYHYLILVAELSDWTDITGNAIDLKAYYPIPIALENNCYISGPSRIIYNYSGSSPNYDESPYILYDSEHNEINVAKWEIRFPGWDDTKKEDTVDKFKYFNSDGTKTAYWENYPELKIADTGEYYLQVLSNIQTNVKPCGVFAYDASNNILWSQPLLILRNEYAFNLLNAWDGNLKIDEDGNTILSQLIGAGVKNEDNSFSGILMGAVGKQAAAATTGIYGLSNGALRFKADEKGDFYVGTGDDNEIDFKSGNLNIAAKNFTLKINNDQNEIQLYLSNKVNSKNAWLQFKDKVYFYNNGAATIGGWSILSDWIQSADIHHEPGEEEASDSHDGVALGRKSTGYALLARKWQQKIDGTWEHIDVTSLKHNGDFFCRSGTIGGWAIEQDYLGHQGASNETVFLSYTGMKPDNTLAEDEDKAFYLFIKDKFGVDTDGSMYATGGKLGTWTLDVNVIKSGRIGEDNSAFMCTGTDGFFKIGGHKGKGWVFGAGEHFGVTNNGELYATQLYATGGKIANWNISGDILYTGDNFLKGGDGVAIIRPTKTGSSGAGTDVIICRDGGKDIFRVNSDGTLLATKATITGTINAGSILGSGFKIVNNGGAANGPGLEIGSRSAGQSWVALEKEYLNAGYRGDTAESARWYAVVFAANEWDNGSDKRLKNSINDFNEKHENFFNNLHPVTFKYNNGRSGRTHSGFIAQEVVASLEESGLSTMDFAAPCLLNYNTDHEGYWWLRRDQFIALNTWQIQKLKARVTELENEIKEIKQQYEI